jgi:hypothetical protein
MFVNIPLMTAENYPWLYTQRIFVKCIFLRYEQIRVENIIVLKYRSWYGMKTKHKIRNSVCPEVYEINRLMDPAFWELPTNSIEVTCVKWNSIWQILTIIIVKYNLKVKFRIQGQFYACLYPTKWVNPLINLIPTYMSEWCKNWYFNDLRNELHVTVHIMFQSGLVISTLPNPTEGVRKC